MLIRKTLWACAMLALGGTAYSQSTTAPSTTQSDSAAVTTLQPPSTELRSVIVSAEAPGEHISSQLGASAYTIGAEQIQSIPQGEDATFQQVLLRAPGVVEDSYGQEHVRGEHANTTYRINGVLLPEGLSGFGQDIDTHLIDSLTLIDGALPSQFGFHTAGIIDVTTKSGQALTGNEISFYGGSYDTFQPSVEFGGTTGKLDYFVTASYKHDSDGIENPTSSFRPIHDDTSQQRAFVYLNYHVDDASSLSLMLNGSYSDFQIPNTAGLQPSFTLAGQPSFDSSALDETQNEQNYYSVISYQHSVDKLSFQASVFSSYAQIAFTPDSVGDLLYQGVAGNVLNSSFTNGAQFDSSYILNDDHTLRAGFLVDYALERLDTNTDVFAVDPITGQQSSDVPINIVDNTGNQATSSGIYLQDEWRLNQQLTLNYGLRYDRFDASFDHEDQVSPRANLVWKINDATTTHFGYARYFVPPPPQNVQESTIQKFVNTTNAPNSLVDDPARVERSDYFDIGITRQISKPWSASLDGFYKLAHNLVDEGQFGQAVIETPFNYASGTVYGAELSTTYKEGGFSTFGNFSWVVTSAHDIDSQQFQIDPDELAYIQSHNIHLDHESEFTASAGVAYSWTNDQVYADILYGSGLRSGFANIDQEQQYYPVNIGYTHIFHPNGAGGSTVQFRADITNVFDQTYQLRSGSGIGVAAPQYGARRGIFAGLTYTF